MLGHAGASPEENPSMQCVGFQTLLSRGAEWAATGRVRQKVPACFPAAGECRRDETYGARR